MPTCRPRCAKADAGVAGSTSTRDTPEGKEILELQRATRFIPTKADNYKGIEAAARSAGLL
jgi:ABC-type phosphate/phosphonate transport system substrate-binding protein